MEEQENKNDHNQQELLKRMLKKSELQNKYLRELATEFKQEQEESLKTNNRLTSTNNELEEQFERQQETINEQELKIIKKDKQIYNLNIQLQQLNRLFTSINESGKYDKLLEMQKQMEGKEEPIQKKRSSNKTCPKLQLQFSKSLVNHQEKSVNKVNQPTSKVKESSQPHDVYIEEITYESLQQLPPPNTIQSIRPSPPKQQQHLFEEFMVIGVPKTDLNGITTNDSLLMNPKILFNYPNHPHNHNQEWKGVIPDFAFPFGCQVDPIDFQDDSARVYSQIFQSEMFSHQRDSFVFMVKNEESYVIDKHVDQNDIIKMCNPNKVLYAVCMQTTDFYETSQNGNRMFWEVQKIYCFLTKYPFIKLFFDIIILLLATLKKKRVTKYTQNITNDMAILSHIDADFIHHALLESIDLLENTLIIQKQLQFESEIKIEFNSGRVCFKLPSRDEAYLEESRWSQTVAFSSTCLDDLIFIYFAILMENSVIFISTNLCLLTSTILTLGSMLYPFKWPHPNILNLPEKLFGLLDSPVPILMGINKGTDFLRENNYCDLYPHCIFVSLDENHIFTNKENFKNVLSNIPEFNHFKNHIKNNYYLLNQNNSCNFVNDKAKQRQNTSIIYNPTPEEQQACLKVIKLFKDSLYENIINKLPHNTDNKQYNQAFIEQTLLKNTKSNDYNFVQKFIQTQIFEYYIQTDYLKQEN